MYYIHFVYHVQRGETPLLRAVRGSIISIDKSSRAGRCKVVKYLVEKKAIDITQLSQVMQYLLFGVYLYTSKMLVDCS